MLEEEMDQIRLLIVGSSHAFEGINPSYLPEGSFNLAGSGQDFYVDYHLLKKYVDSIPNLETVLLPVSYHSFFNSLEYSDLNDNRIDFYTKTYGVYRNDYNPLKELQPEIISYGMKRAVYFAFLESESDKFELIHGHFARERDSSANANTTDPKIVKQNVDDYHNIMSPDLLSWNQYWFSESIKLLSEKGVQPIIISTPIYHTFYDNMNAEYFDQMQASVSVQSEKFELPYLNFMNSRDFDADDFNNANHLNNLGAIKFAKILSDTLSTFQ